jgi:hypothetical protein
MGRLPLNRVKDFGDAQHDQILDFRLTNVDLGEDQPLCQAFFFAPFAPLRDEFSRKDAKAQS